MSSGLVRVASESSGPTSALARRLSERLEQGQDLGAAIDAEGDHLPQAYRTLVKAGLQSGRLTAALEGYSETATRMAELRRTVCLATIYPVILLMTMWTLFVFLNEKVLPSFDWMEIQDRLWVESIRSWLDGSSSVLQLLVWLVVPLGLLGVTWLWWRKSAGAAEATVTAEASWLAWIPGVERTRRLSCEAVFADLLRLFVEQRVPLREALPLAAKGSGLQVVSPEMRELVSYVEAGNALGTQSPAFRSLPPLVRLAFVSGGGSASLSRGLQRAVSSYRTRAHDLARSVSFYVPIGITALVGGSCVAVYAVLILQPYVAALKEFTGWH